MLWIKCQSQIWLFHVFATACFCLDLPFVRRNFNWSIIVHNEFYGYLASARMNIHLHSGSGSYPAAFKHHDEMRSRPGHWKAAAQWHRGVGASLLRQLTACCTYLSRVTWDPIISILICLSDRIVRPEMALSHWIAISGRTLHNWSRLWTQAELQAECLPLHVTVNLVRLDWSIHVLVQFDDGNLSCMDIVRSLCQWSGCWKHACTDLGQKQVCIPQNTEQAVPLRQAA